MNEWLLVIVSVVNDFILTAGSALSGGMVQQGSSVTLPSRGVWLLALVAGLMGASRHLQALLKAPPASNGPAGFPGGPVKRLLPILLIPLALLAGCASQAKAADLFQSLRSSVLMQDLQQAQVNLSNAIANGDLPKDDPAATCLTGVVGSVTPAPNALPYEVKGLVSLGSILYIDAHKLGKAKAAADQSCRAIIGQFVIDGIQQVNPIKLPGG